MNLKSTTETIITPNPFFCHNNEISVPCNYDKTHPINLSSGEKPTPQENQSEVLKALQDQNLLNSGVAGMAELQGDRNESTQFDLFSIQNN